MRCTSLASEAWDQTHTRARTHTRTQHAPLGPSRIICFICRQGSATRAAGSPRSVELRHGLRKLAILSETFCLSFLKQQLTKPL